jgi:hypothetical protein
VNLNDLWISQKCSPIGRTNWYKARRERGDWEVAPKTHIWFGPTVGDITGFLHLQFPRGLVPWRCVDHEPSSAGQEVGVLVVCLGLFSVYSSGCWSNGYILKTK